MTKVECVERTDVLYHREGDEYQALFSVIMAKLSTDRFIFNDRH